MIQDMYFAGGVALFAMCFDQFFLHHHNSQEVTKVEVSVPMVALITTAVRFFTSHASISMFTWDVAICCRV